MSCMNLLVVGSVKLVPIAVAHSPMPYIDAIESNSVGQVSLLLALGAKPNRIPDINQYPHIVNSPLQLAAQNNAAEVTEVLLAVGARSSRMP